MYRINSAGAISSTRTVAFPDYRRAVRPPSAPRAADRSPTASSAGAYAAGAAAEGFGIAWGLGAIDRHGYLLETPVVFRAGSTSTAYRPIRGNVVGHKTITDQRDELVDGSGRATAGSSGADRATSSTAARSLGTGCPCRPRSTSRDAGARRAEELAAVERAGDDGCPDGAGVRHQ